MRGRAARVQNGQVGAFGVRPPNARLEGRAGHLSSRKCAHVCVLEMCQRSPGARSACCGSFRRQSVHVVAAGVISVILGLVVHVIGWLPPKTRDHRITWDTRRELWPTDMSSVGTCCAASASRSTILAHLHLTWGRVERCRSRKGVKPAAEASFVLIWHVSSWYDAFWHVFLAEILASQQASL